MNYAEANYSTMSDAHIAAEVLKIKHNKEGRGLIALYETHAKLIRDYDTFSFDLNDPRDVWPIIVENDIMLNPNCADSLWKAEQGLRIKPIGFYDVATCYDKKPLRAAMIVFLMMNEV